MSQTARDLLFVLAILAVTLAIHFNVLFLGEIYSPSGDITYQNLPWRDFYASELKQGRLAVWYPYQACGFPLFAEGQTGMLYPPNLILFRYFSTWRAIVYGCALSTFLAGLGAYFLFRRFTLPSTSAFYAAMLYMLCGPMIAHLGHFNLVAVASLMPLFILSGLNVAGIYFGEPPMLDKSTMHRRSLRFSSWMFWCPLFLSLMWLAGHPQMTMISIIALVILLTVFYISSDWHRRQSLFGFFFLPGISIVWGTLVAFDQLWPTRELLALSNRAAFTLSDFTSYSFPPQMLTTLVHPFVFGAANAWRSPEYHGPQGFVERVCFIGAIPVFLIAVYALLQLVRRRKKGLPASSSDEGSSANVSNAVLLVLSISAVVFLLFALGKWGGIYYILKIIPGYGATRIPSRFLFPLILMLAGIAGFALDRLSALINNRTILRGAYFLIVILSFAQLRSFHQAFNLTSPESSVVSIPEAYNEAKKTNRYSRIFQYISPAEAAAHGVSVDASAASAGNGSTIDTSNEYQDILEPALPELNKDVIAPEIEYDKPCYPAYAGIGSVGWAGELVLRDYKRFFDATLARSDSSLALQRRAEVVSWLNAEPSHVMAYGRAALPGYYLCGAVKKFDDDDAVEKYLGSAFPLYLDQIALVVGEPRISPAMGGVSSVKLVKNEPTRQEYEIQCDRDKFFVRTIAYYPGWKAYLDGVEIEVLKTDLAFQGVAMPAGEHKLVFQFAEPNLNKLIPWSLRVLAGLTVLAAVATLSNALLKRVNW